MRNRIIFYILVFGCLFFGLKTDSFAQMPAAQTTESGEKNEKIDSSIATFYFDPSAQTGGGNKKTFNVAFNTATKSPHSTRYVHNNNFESHISFGKDRVVHRIITDRKAGLYFGYDVEITPVPSTNKFKVSFKALSIKPTSGVCLNNLAAQALPKFPGEMVIEDGDTIALDILEKPQTRVKVVDHIRISSKLPTTSQSVAVSSFTPRMAANRARDFSPDTFKLKLDNVELFVNEERVKEKRTGRGASTAGKVLFLYVPDKGRFIFSLSPQPGFSFRKIGLIEDNKISFSIKGEKYQLISNAPILAVSGKWNLWVLHDSQYQPNFRFTQRYVYGSAEQVQNLFREK